MIEVSIYVLTAIFTGLVPFFYGLGYYERHAGRKSALYFWAATFCLLCAVGFGWLAGKGWML